MAQLLSHRPDAEHVDIGEIQVGFGVEIFIPQVAPAHDRDAVVCQPEFVMHAPVLQRQVEQAPHGACHARAAAQMQRVEQANFDLGMGGKGRDDLVEPVAGGVIQQDAHTHAAVGGLEQFINQHARADAVMHDVVLQVEAGLGVADQLGAGHEGFAAVGQQTKARAALIRRRLGLDRAAEGRLCRCQGITGHARCVGRRTATQCQRSQQEKR